MNIDFTLFGYLALCIFFTTSCTIIGATSVFFLKKESPKLESFCTGFAGGVMIAGSFFSLINPALELCPEKIGYKLGFIIGGLALGLVFMFVCEHVFLKEKEAFSPKVMFLAITLHNIPEGMCIGVAFAMGGLGNLAGAIALAIGIGIQNLPEGASVSLPMYSYCKDKKKAFRFGLISALVEPIGAILAFVFASVVSSVLPLLLCFAGSCMIFVVLTDLMPESCIENKKIATISMAIGFIIMTMLDLLL